MAPRRFLANRDIGECQEGDHRQESEGESRDESSRTFHWVGKRDAGRIPFAADTRPIPAGYSNYKIPGWASEIRS